MRIRRIFIVSVLTFTMCAIAGSTMAVNYYEAMSNDQLNQALAATEKEYDQCQHRLSKIAFQVAKWESGYKSVRIQDYNAAKEEIVILKKCIADAGTKVDAIKKKYIY